MNIIETIEYYMNEFNMNEEDAEKQASIDFDIYVKENPYEGL